MKRTTILVVTGALLAAVAGEIVRAQATSAAEGVYSEEQTKKGAEVFKRDCVMCHGEELAGGNGIPPLAGPTWMKIWSRRTVGELFEKIHMTMPSLNPGILTEDETAELIAFILSRNGFPAGKAPLANSADALIDVKIDTPKK